MGTVAHRRSNPGKREIRHSVCCDSNASIIPEQTQTNRLFYDANENIQRNKKKKTRKKLESEERRGEETISHRYNSEKSFATLDKVTRAVLFLTFRHQKLISRLRMFMEIQSGVFTDEERRFRKILICPTRKLIPVECFIDYVHSIRKRQRIHKRPQ